MGVGVAVASVGVVVVAGVGVDSALVSTGPFVLVSALVAEVAAVVVFWEVPLCFEEAGDNVLAVSLVGDVGDVTP